MKTMRAQVFSEPRKMRLQDSSIPCIDDSEILIAVKACGICGSDLAYYFGESPLETPTGKGPLILGHEFTGEVVEVGAHPEALGLFRKRDRVVANPAQQCNSCSLCARGYFNLCRNTKVSGVSVDGAFAEFAKVKYTHVHRLPDNLSFIQGALIEPLSCATYAVEQLEVGLGDTVVVFGPGPIGLMMVQLVKAKGAGKVILVGRGDYRLELGAKLGADTIVNVWDTSSPHYATDLVGVVKDRTNGEMVPRVIVPTSSVAAMHLALQVSGPRSIVVFFGLGGKSDVLQVPFLETITADKVLKFSWLAPLVWPKAIRALESGKVKVDSLITHSFKLDELVAGIEFMRNSKENKVKAVVLP